MQFSKIWIFALPALAIAAPSVATGQSSTDAVYADYETAAGTAVSRLSIFGCNIAGCVEALAPLLASCAIAAASEGKNTARDASCVADAYKNLSTKPAACNHCYK